MFVIHLVHGPEVFLVCLLNLRARYEQFCADLQQKCLNSFFLNCKTSLQQNYFPIMHLLLFVSIVWSIEKTAFMDMVLLVFSYHKQESNDQIKLFILKLGTKFSSSCVECPCPALQCTIVQGAECTHGQALILKLPPWKVRWGNSRNLEAVPLQLWDTRQQINYTTVLVAFGLIISCGKQLSILRCLP